MAFRKILAQRLIYLTKISSPTSKHGPLSSFPSLRKLVPAYPGETTFRREFLNAPDSDEKGIFRRFIQKREIVQSAMSPEITSVPIGDKLIEKLKGMTMSRDRLRLDGLSPMKRSDPPIEEITVDVAKKLLRLSQMEMLKSALRRVQKNTISYSEFVQICGENTSADQGLEYAKMLDESGAVIVLGNAVFLRPEQVTKAIQGLIPQSINATNDLRRKEELEKMEKEKWAIDREAVLLVRKELWAGLGFLIVQTAGLARLTFWELSWDVMEPVCFFVTSVYFMLGYGFFLVTSKNPSFEGFFESRFRAKQKRLMKEKKFDMERFEELGRAFYPLSSSEPAISSCPELPSASFARTLIGAHKKFQ